MLDKKKLLGVGITNASKEEILEYILQGLEKSQEKYYVVTPNPEILVYANKHPEFKSILNNARLALSDGVGVILAGKFLGKRFKERVTGTDLVENLCKVINGKPITVGFLGGGPKIAERTAECLRSRYPGLRVVFAAPEWDKNGFSFRNKYHVLSIKYQGNREKENLHNTEIDILFVAFGFPKQEEWMAANLNKRIFQIAIGVGGAFDYISGNVPRAPVWVQNLGFEWLYRLIRQPWRVRRQLALLEFVFLVLKERFKLPHSKPLAML